MGLTPADASFVEANPQAAMITIGADGMPKTARVAVGIVDGRLWSSGTRDRVRTRRLVRDPRCTLYVHEAGPRWLTLETTVRILDDESVPEHSLAFFRQLQHKPTGPLSWFGGEHDEAAFLDLLRSEGRILYEFDVHRSYGLR